MIQANTIEIGDYVSITSDSQIFKVIDLETGRKYPDRLKCSAYPNVVMYIPLTWRVYKRTVEKTGLLSVNCEQIQNFLNENKWQNDDIIQ